MNDWEGRGGGQKLQVVRNNVHIWFQSWQRAIDIFLWRIVIAAFVSFFDGLDYNLVMTRAENNKK